MRPSQPHLRHPREFSCNFPSIRKLLVHTPKRPVKRHLDVLKTTIKKSKSVNSDRKVGARAARRHFTSRERSKAPRTTLGARPSSLLQMSRLTIVLWHVSRWSEHLRFMGESVLARSTDLRPRENLREISDTETPWGLLLCWIACRHWFAFR